MKIAFIINGFPYLSETFILNQIIGLIDLGHEVEIFAEIKPDESAVHPDVEKYGLMEHVYYLPDLPKNRILAKLKILLFVARQFTKRPLETLKNLIAAFSGMLSSVSARWLYLLFYIPKDKFDIIHCHHGNYGLVGIALHRAGVKGKIVAEYHGEDVAITSGYKKQLRDKLFNECDLFLVVCDYFIKKLVSMGCNNNKIICHHTGIYLNKFKFRVRTTPLKDSVRILTIARLTKMKGIEYSIRAIAALIKNNYNIEYIVVGSGELKEELQTLTSDMGIDNNVKFVAAVSQDKIFELLNNAHIFLLSSIILDSGQEEGIANVLKEAMASGLPVVSTYQGGTAELVVDNVSGLLAPIKDVDALANKLEYLIGHPDLWPEIGQNARIAAAKNFDSVKLNIKLENVYRKLVTA
jgi:colanic acid/amylovoran biosynthesis glycosyltransferase